MILHLFLEVRIIFHVHVELLRFLLGKQDQGKSLLRSTFELFPVPLDGLVLLRKGNIIRQKSSYVLELRARTGKDDLYGPCRICLFIAFHS